MALVLNTQITLNPGNQFAHLADDTGLVGATQYVISGLYLAPNTRFVYEGTLDITLNVPPVGVPGADTVTNCSISTVQLPAPIPPPAAYPYAQKDRLLAADLNHGFESSPDVVPPYSANGYAHLGKPWLDTSVTPPQFRMCAVAIASPTYLPAEWFTLGPIQGGQNLSSVYMPLTGDSTKTGKLNVTGDFSTGGALNVTGASTLAGTLTVTGAATLSGGVTGNLSVSGSLTAGGNVTASGSVFSSGNFYGPATGFSLLAPGNVNAGVIDLWANTTNMLGSAAVSGNFQAGGQIYTPGNVIGNNSVQSNGVYFQNYAGWFYVPQNFFSGGAVGVGGSTGIYWTNYGGWMYCPVGVWCSNINTGSINMNGGGLSGCGNIAGASEGSIGGVVMPGDGSLSVGSSLNVGGNIGTPNNVFCNAVFVGGGGGPYWSNNAGWMYTPFWLKAAGIIEADGGGDCINAPNGNFWTGHELHCSDRGVQYYNVGGNGWNFRWDGTYMYARVDNSVEFMFAGYGSDARLKTDIAPSTYDCLATVLKVPLYEFRWCDLGSEPAAHIDHLAGKAGAQGPQARVDGELVPVGFIAQELQPVFPASVFEGDDPDPDNENVAEHPATTWSIQQNVMLALLTGAIQQIVARLEVLEGGTVGTAD